MKTLDLFNAVLEKKTKKKAFVSEDGYVIAPGALWAKDKIIGHYKKKSLDGNQLNKTFHKSWKKIKDSSRADLLVSQILHYVSTYGSNFEGDIYIPEEVLKVPNTRIVFKVIKSYTKKQMIDKCLGMLQSGAALKEDTVDDLISILVDELGYAFTGKEGIKNNEAVVKIADLYGVIPEDFMSFFRYVVYRATDSTLIIKDSKTISAIKESNYNPAAQFKKFGLSKLAENFNRFKPLFLAFKNQCPKTINKISKLSKKKHKPMVQNPLNLATQRVLTEDDNHWLDNATPYALFKAMSATYLRACGQKTFMYKIRNGRSWVQADGKNSVDEYLNKKNYKYLLRYMKKRFDLKGRKIFVPEDVVYALPTSEKMYVGNIPMGTKFYGTKLAVGVYWENSWGAHDLDLSALNFDGKVGWNSSYNQHDGSLLFSGDITSAPDGAVEYLHASRGLKHPSLVLNNIYSGDANSGFKIIVGHGDRITKKYMMDPNNLLMEARVDAIQNEDVLGIFLPEGKRQSFVLLHFGCRNVHVSANSNRHESINALFEEWKNPLSFTDVVKKLGAKIVKRRKGADIDLSLDSLESDSFLKIFYR